MTADQFTALAEARRLIDSPSRTALQLMLVDGLPAAEAAEQAGCSYRAAWMAHDKHTKWVALLERAGFVQPR